MNKKLLPLLLTLGLSASAMAAAPLLQQSGSHNFVMSEDLQATKDITNSWGASEKLTTVQFTISSTTIVTSPAVGVVDRVCLSSGVLGDWAVIVDTINTAGAGTPGIPALIANTTKIVGFMDMLPTAPFTNAATFTGNGCKVYNPPLPFSTGLSAVMSAATSLMSISYRIYKQ